MLLLVGGGVRAARPRLLLPLAASARGGGGAARDRAAEETEARARRWQRLHEYGETLQRQAAPAAAAYRRANRSDGDVDDDVAAAAADVDDDRDRDNDDDDGGEGARRSMASQHVGMVVLPRRVDAALTAFVRDERANGAQIRADAAALSATLRARVDGRQRPARGRVVYERPQAVAYAATRFAHVYAATARVLQELQRRLPRWTPQTHLDFGTGPGTTVAAAWETFAAGEDTDDDDVSDGGGDAASDNAAAAAAADDDAVQSSSSSSSSRSTRGSGGLRHTTAVESSDAMHAVGLDVLQRSGRTAHDVAWRAYLPSAVGCAASDLVTAGYVLSELPASPSARRDVVHELWAHTAGCLVLIEPGTAVGSRNIIEARRTLLEGREHVPRAERPFVLAPCSHDAACPLAGDADGRFCHFSQRVQKSAAQMRRAFARRSARNYVDEKFSYVVVARGAALDRGVAAADDGDAGAPTTVAAASLTWPRLMFAPIKRGGHVVLDVCRGPAGDRVGGDDDDVDGSDGDGAEVERVVVSAGKARSRRHYRAARKSRWGDLLDPLTLVRRP